MPSVLIIVDGGDADFVTDDDPCDLHVAVLNMARLRSEAKYPDEVRAVASCLRELPGEIPQRKTFLRELKVLEQELVEQVRDRYAHYDFDDPEEVLFP